MDFWVALLIVVFTVLVLTLVTNPRALGFGRPRAPIETEPLRVGGLTLEALAYYSGYDWSKPLVVAVKGKIYDVTKSMDVYGPCKPFHAYAGKEVALALAKASTAPEDVAGGPLNNLTEEETARLAEEVAKFDARYPVIGQVVPMLEMTAAELSKHDGSDPALPLYLAIKGTVYDITKGKQFYGPDGIYPFAGHEVARAFALLSTELSDCTDDLTDLGRMELENLRDWIAKFNSKYHIVGSLTERKKEQ